ncbi:MAG: glutamate synthase-related protein [Edaphobacter sp.]
MAAAYGESAAVGGGSARNVPQPADPAEAFAIFTKDVIARDPAVLRDLLEIRPAGAELALSEVEPQADLYKRFVASAMSLGSLSPEAHQTITAAMNMLGGRSNTGEGGEDPAAYRVPAADVAPSSGDGGGADTGSCGRRDCGGGDAGGGSSGACVAE